MRAYRNQAAGSDRYYRQQREIAIRRDGHRCRWCGDTVHPRCTTRGCDLCLNTDHLKVKAEGGNDHASNLIVACSWCNQNRGTKPRPDPKPRTDAAHGLVMAGVRRSW